MDADDISLPKRIELQIKHMYNNELDVCGSHHCIIDQNGEDKGFSYVPLLMKTVLLDYYLLFRLPIHLL